MNSDISADLSAMGLALDDTPVVICRRGDADEGVLMEPVSEGVHSFDEWSTLREAIVGTVGDYSFHHLDRTFSIFYWDSIYSALSRGADHPTIKSGVVRIPRWIRDELTEDIDELVGVLRAFGVNVLRPATSHRQVSINTPHWSSYNSCPLNIRDQTIILGTTIVETAPHIRGRLFENDQLKPLFNDYFHKGAGWISMPRPTLGKDTLDTGYYVDRGPAFDEAVPPDRAGGVDRLGYEIVFDGAQCVRFGADVLVNVANINHQMAFSWLERTFGDKFNFHYLRGVADSHIDSIVLPLRPGVLLLRSPSYLSQLPEALQSWNCLYAPPVDEARFPTYEGDLFHIASRHIDMNVLSLDENTVVINSLYPELIKLLEQNGFTVVPVRHRHRRLFGGGFHCFTLDCVRSAPLGSYF
jgi:glycine amidinotransferase